MRALVAGPPLVFPEAPKAETNVEVKPRVRDDDEAKDDVPGYPVQCCVIPAWLHREEAMRAVVGETTPCYRNDGCYENGHDGPQRVRNTPVGLQTGGCAGVLAVDDEQCGMDGD